MEPITTTLLGIAIHNTLPYLYEKYFDNVVENVVEQVSGEKELKRVVDNALEAVDFTLDDEDAVTRSLMECGLDQLTSDRNGKLRREIARTLLTFTNANSPPPQELMERLKWPRSQPERLAQLLVELRAGFATLPEWKPLFDYANWQENQRQLQTITAQLERQERLWVLAQESDLFKNSMPMNEELAAEVEDAYRQTLISDLRKHNFRGILQMQRDLQLPLADIYQELGLRHLSQEAVDQGHRAEQEALRALDPEQRLAREERHSRDRVTDALAQHQRLVMLGAPGAGKTMSLNYTVLMLAHGNRVNQLGLETAYIPIAIRLADYARALKENPTLALESYLLTYVKERYPLIERLDDYLRWALNKGGCMVLLDGLDEVGDNPEQGIFLRAKVVKSVQLFGDRLCDSQQNPQQTNRLLVTSRIEGYEEYDLRGFYHVQLSPLRPPDEVKAFLFRWLTAHEIDHDPELTSAQAEQRATQKVNELLPRIIDNPGVSDLATNPLLLTILALIQENVGRLPNRRVKLYEICTETLIDSWRQEQSDMPNRLALYELNEKDIMQIMASLAYWLHETYPGGTAPLADWHQRLSEILVGAEYEKEKPEAPKIATDFLEHARTFTGLLAEKGLGLYGFFHLTFEEYLAAYELAGKRSDERQEILRQHWEDPRWQEVILLAAGQLSIAPFTKKEDVSGFINDLREMEASNQANEGREFVLAGRALADIGYSSVTKRTQRWVLGDLENYMRDWNPDTDAPYDPPKISIPIRYQCGEILDELGWLPRDLNEWVHCPGCADDGGDLWFMKYPLTNAHFAPFVESDGYTNALYWQGEESADWRWLQDEHPDYRGDGPISQPEYWNDHRFGKERRGYPVVGISWYEAWAYARWLSQVLAEVRSGKQVADELEKLVADLIIKLPSAGLETPFAIRLPTEQEWEKAAGGSTQDRFAWDPVEGPATQDEQQLLARTNIHEASLNSTSPVAMYPLGASRPHKLMDLSGNVWEWTDSWYDENESGRVLRGGSGLSNEDYARVGYRSWNVRVDSIIVVGCRLVVSSPFGSEY